VSISLIPHPTQSHTANTPCPYTTLFRSGMEEEYRKAIEVNPNNASARQELGELLDAMGRLDEGLNECQIVQQLDPSHDHLSGARSEEHTSELQSPDHLVSRLPL